VPSRPLVAVLNEAAARALWPGERAVGRRVLDNLERAYTVIGVVANTSYATLSDRDLPMVFMSVLQESVAGRVSVIARTDADEAGLTALRAAIREADPGLAIVDERRVEAQVAQLLAPQRFGAMLLSVSGAVALVIAAIGLYASLAHATARRRPEIGIRLALGARPAALVRLVFARAAFTVTLGAVAGLALALLAARTLERFLVGITPVDPPALTIAVAVFGVVMLLAALIPARRIIRTDPVAVMREN
jgi:ABC-type antimicrobial peptide transport system permease subunit